MSWTLEIASNAAASAWTDLTDAVDRTGFRFAGIANRAEIDGGSGFDLADDAAAITLPTRRVVRLTEDATASPTVLFRGRTVNDTTARGLVLEGDARQFDVSLVDNNAHFGGITIVSVSRPAETDVARMTWLLETYLQGTRASTDLTDTYLLSTSPITLPAKKYEVVSPGDIIADIVAQTGKQCFVTVDDELFYGPDTATDYAASLSISDDPGDAPDGETVFAPGDDTQRDRDGSEFFSRVHVIYKNNAVESATSATAETNNDVWSTSINDQDIATSAQAASRASVFLAEFDHVETRYRTSILLRDDQVDLVKYGQTISFRSAAAGLLTADTVRIARLEWEPLPPTHYLAKLELAYPAKLKPRVGGGGVGGGPTKPPSPFVPLPDVDVNCDPETGYSDDGSGFSTGDMGGTWSEDTATNMTSAVSGGVATFTQTTPGTSGEDAWTLSGISFTGPWRLEAVYTLPQVGTGAGGPFVGSNANCALIVNGSISVFFNYGSGDTPDYVGDASVQFSGAPADIDEPGWGVGPATVQLMLRHTSTPGVGVEVRAVSGSIDTGWLDTGQSGANVTSIGIREGFGGDDDMAQPASGSLTSLVLYHAGTPCDTLTGLVSNRLYGPVKVGVGNGSRTAFSTSVPYAALSLAAFTKSGSTLVQQVTTSQTPADGGFEIAAPSGGVEVWASFVPV